MPDEWMERERERCRMNGLMWREISDEWIDVERDFG